MAPKLRSSRTASTSTITIKPSIHKGKKKEVKNNKQNKKRKGKGNAFNVKELKNTLVEFVEEFLSKKAQVTTEKGLAKKIADVAVPRLTAKAMELNRRPTGSPIDINGMKDNIGNLKRLVTGILKRWKTAKKNDGVKNYKPNMSILVRGQKHTALKITVMSLTKITGAEINKAYRGPRRDKPWQKGIHYFYRFTVKVGEPRGLVPLSFTVKSEGQPDFEGKLTLEVVPREPLTKFTTKDIVVYLQPLDETKDKPAMMAALESRRPTYNKVKEAKEAKEPEEDEEDEEPEEDEEDEEIKEDEEVEVKDEDEDEDGDKEVEVKEEELARRPCSPNVAVSDVEEKNWNIYWSVEPEECPHCDPEYYRALQRPETSPRQEMVASDESKFVDEVWDSNYE